MHACYRQTDGRTDRILIVIPRCIPCSAVKTHVCAFSCAEKHLVAVILSFLCNTNSRSLDTTPKVVELILELVNLYS